MSRTWKGSRTLVFAWILPFALVGLPAIPIGGTLPAVLLGLNPRPGKIGRAGGGMYAANTAGAIVGALASVFSPCGTHA